MDTSASGARLALERRQARAVHKLRRYLAISKLAQISAGELPIRGAGRTALHLADIHTAADVLRRPASAIYGIPQVGWLSLLEFMRLFQRHGANFVWWQERPARLPDRLRGYARRLRNVMEKRLTCTGEMPCSQSCRISPLNR